MLLLWLWERGPTEPDNPTHRPDDKRAGRIFFQGIKFGRKELGGCG